MSIGNYLADFIDYTKPGIFMITICKHPDQPDFSRLVVKENESLLEKKYTVEYYPLGNAIANTIRKVPKLYPGLAVKQYKIMPDHLHLILQIEKKIDEPLGNKIAKFKREAFYYAEAHQFPMSPVRTLFKEGFNDLFLKSSMSLDVLYNYIKENPYRRWMILNHPDFFERIDDVELNGTKVQLYGNQLLMNHPFIYPVVVHRRFSKEEREFLRREWSYAIENGGVLIGAFVAEEEKEVFAEILEKGGRVILLRNHALKKKEKPQGKLYQLALQGNLLMISPEMNFKSYIYPDGRKLSQFRQECKFMNSLAESFAGGKRH